jgi:uncharacterized membrane protein YbhN (UPF0104 family)
MSSIEERGPLRARPIEPPTAVEMPSEFQPRRLLRRSVPVFMALAILVLVVVLTPGLGDVRERLGEADPAWLALAVLLEFLSGVSYVLMFRPVFCTHMPWRTSWDISWSSLAVGSIVPASGAGGLALGAWILHEGGMSGERIARRSVAFFLIKSSVNFVAVAVLGTLLAVGLVGPELSLWLTALPAALAILLLVAVAFVPRLGPGPPAPADAGRFWRGLVGARRALVVGTAEAIELIRSRNRLILVGAIGYWAWDNAVLWATFQAFDSSPELSIILMGYLIGQLGGLLPLPGGVGGIDGGLIGTLVVYGAPAAATVAAVLAYRLILFWLPLLVGAVAFVQLRRALDRAERRDLCEPIPAG